MANRLAGETSPYLLQHKDNPVDWYPWGDDANHAALRLELSRGRARFAFVAADGRVLHHGSMRCRPLR